MNRFCTGCKKDKPLEEYYKRTRNGKIRYGRCKQCEKIKIQEWRIKNPEANKKIYTKSRYKSVYGLDISEVPKKGDCPICKRTNLKLVVDHCHKSGKVRDFICYNCNTLLGHVENKSKMDKVYSYIRKHNE